MTWFDDSLKISAWKNSQEEDEKEREKICYKKISQFVGKTGRDFVGKIN